MVAELREMRSASVADLQEDRPLRVLTNRETRGYAARKEERGS
jgi:hypothetical protein